VGEEGSMTPTEEFDMICSISKECSEMANIVSHLVYGLAWDSIEESEDAE